jgi:signal transduction histidine kinase
MTGGPAVATVRLVPRADRIIDWWRRVPPLVADAALAAVVAVVTVVSIAVEDADDPSMRLTRWGVVSLVVQFVPLVWRRRAPVLVLSLVGVGTVGYGMAELPDPAIVFALALAIYTVAAHRPRTVTVPCLVALIVTAALAMLFGDGSDAADVAVNYLVGTTSWVVGDIVRGQREQAAALDARRVDEARRAAADERVRIARDLHDVVAHHISVIVVQAEAAQEVMATQPDRADRAMAAVADTARTALGELRRMLGLLRSDAGLAPQPDLAALDDLVASVRQAGLAVDVRTTGDERPVDGVVGVTAYRVVQEALTNVLRHARASHARVDLAFGDGALVVTVSDDGRGARGADGSGRNGPLGEGPVGHGLIGMRERVTVVGGDLVSGPGPAGGFTVRARLPLPA